MKNFFKKAFLALCIISIASCSDDDDTTFIPDAMTIADFVADNADYSSLLAALERTNLDVTLNGNGTFTVFAPNNAAFTEFLGGTPLEDVPVETLEQILLNHVLGTTQASTSLTTGYVKNLATESNSSTNISMYINTTNGVVINGEATVTTPDIMTDNGIIHAVDKVIPLPTMLTFVTADSNFSSLAGAATTSGFDTDFVAVLSGEDSNLTLLAPDNDAFTALGDISGLSTAALEQVLLNHVIAGTNISTSLTTSYNNTLATYGDTMDNLSIYINTDSGVSFNGISEVSEADIVASNGVIHKVNAVITLPTVVTFATADATFSNLVAALTRDDQLDENYVATLSTENGTSPAPFTVFAPTDDAFASLLTELGAASLADIAEATLTATLNLHVVAEANVREENLMTGTVTTLGGDITADATNATLTDANDRVSNIIVTNVQAANGVIHAIDKVILPEL
ncbi:Uncaracterized surface protein containing fasciclin (FAS1) repeats [Aquimarina amphilecti]|uniref:Uncaracterized surface protein containing fasciclin (FAS1) repeats n=1 Tax=Aquimarina amphilecti TaxID=1038014 RepID=A0A1H7UJM9_AQUAM|nr:fasciclin domain-containing protein [Aquimarina amphilecti]SEL97019.1 Uncaracterized surface protein containing fasciclin (FAS1) repeats [Aquimarina amphilecti]